MIYRTALVLTLAMMLVACGESEPATDGEAAEPQNQPQEQQDNSDGAGLTNALRDGADGLQGLTDQVQDQASEQVRAKLKDWQGEIQQFATQARDQGNAKLADLTGTFQEKMEQARTKLNELKAASGERADRIRDELSDLFEELSATYEQIKQAASGGDEQAGGETAANGG